MRIGVHVSIAGGLPEAVKRATARGCESMQIFSGNPRNWRDWEVSDEEGSAFMRDRLEAGVFPLIVHAPYLVNPASEKKEVRNLSLLSTIKAVKVADRVGASAFVVHAGSAGIAPRRAALDWIAAFAHLAIEGAKPRLGFLLENTAGGGGQVCSTFDELAKIIDLVGRPSRLGVCLDTAHAFAAGYDLSTPSSFEAVLEEFDAKIGLDRLGVVHSNDSKFPLSSNRDRHEHIGEGHIGMEGFRALLNHPKLEKLPLILETPGSEADDIRNVTLMKTLRR